MNANANGHATPTGGTPPQVVQVNPIQAAQFALGFLARCTLQPSEREAYGIAEGLLQAIASGSVVLSQAQPAAGAYPPAIPPAMPGEPEQGKQ